MNDKYELWTKWPREDWKFFKSGNDIKKLQDTAKRIAKSLGISCKIFAIRRFEQPLKLT